MAFLLPKLGQYPNTSSTLIGLTELASNSIFVKKLIKKPYLKTVFNVLENNRIDWIVKYYSNKT